MRGGERPYYVPIGNEEQVFKAAFRQDLSVLLKGPTGCGKTRFVEAMAFDLDRPLITVACHDDLTTADLVGRFLLERDATIWVDGPLTQAVREGAICYLDEIVEARQDTTVVLHPLADHRRQTADRPPGNHLRGGGGILPGRLLQPRLSERPEGPEGLDPPADGSHRVRLPPTGCRGEDRCPTRRGSTRTRPAQLVQLGQAIRRLDTVGLREVASTRVLIAAGRLAVEGLSIRDACRAAVAGPLTDDPVVTAGLFEMIDAYLGGEPAGPN